MGSRCAGQRLWKPSFPRRQALPSTLGQETQKAEQAARPAAAWASLEGAALCGLPRHHTSISLPRADVTGMFVCRPLQDDQVGTFLPRTKHGWMFNERALFGHLPEAPRPRPPGAGSLWAPPPLGSVSARPRSAGTAASAFSSYLQGLIGSFYYSQLGFLIKRKS